MITMPREEWNEIFILDDVNANMVFPSPKAWTQFSERTRKKKGTMVAPLSRVEPHARRVWRWSARRPAATTRELSLGEKLQKVDRVPAKGR